MCGYNPPCPGCAGLRWVLAAPHPGLVSAGKVGTSRAVQGEGWHCLVAGSPGAGQYRVWVAGKNSLLFPLKKFAGNHRRKETQRARAQRPLCPHPVSRSKSFKVQSGPIPAPGAGKLPGQPRKARHGGCSHSGQWAGCQPELPQSWPSPFVCMGSASSGLGCPGWWGLLAASRSHLALATRRQLAS